MVLSHADAQRRGGFCFRYWEFWSLGGMKSPRLQDSETPSSESNSTSMGPQGLEIVDIVVLT